MTLSKTSRNLLLLILVLSTSTLIGSVFFMGGIERGWISGLLVVSHIYLIYLLIKGERVARHFLGLNIWIVLLSSIGLMYSLPGLRDTLSGEMCSGFFGSQINCLDSARLSIAILLYNPLIAFSTIFASVTSFVLQLTAAKQ